LLNGAHCGAPFDLVTAFAFSTPLTKFSGTLFPMPFKRTAKKDYTEETLYDYAIGALGRRMRSVAELKRLMRPRVSHQQTGDRMIEAVVERLKQAKYLNDTSYAESYSRYRKENEKFGKLRVINDLKTRGVHGDVINKAIGTTYGDTDEVELARKFLDRKRVKHPEGQKDFARIVRLLLRAGFSSRSAFRVLNQWKVDPEVVSALEAEIAEMPEKTESSENE
jgi:regulatory protein